MANRSRCILVEWESDDDGEEAVRESMEYSANELMEELVVLHHADTRVRNPAVSISPGSEVLVGKIRQTNWVVCSQHGIMGQGHCQITNCEAPYEVLWAVPGESK